MDTQEPLVERKSRPEPAGYPSAAASNGDGFSGEPGFSHTPRGPRNIDRTMGWVLTFVGLLVIFLLIVSLLANIAPNAPTELVPTLQPVTSDPSDLGIQGD